jgi:hypothetical protein
MASNVRIYALTHRQSLIQVILGLLCVAHFKTTPLFSFATQMALHLSAVKTGFSVLAAFRFRQSPFDFFEK